jgi:hypothetical protein
MQDSTLKILDATLKADPSVSPTERRRILRIVRHGENIDVPFQNGNLHAPRIYNRAAAAVLLGDKTPRYVDQLCKRGLLKKFTPKGNQRAIGICGHSLHAFISGN